MVKQTKYSSKAEVLADIYLDPYAAYLYELYSICIGYIPLPLNACHRVLLTV